jgi:hypothetical protein
MTWRIFSRPCRQGFLKHAQKALTIKANINTLDIIKTENFVFSKYIIKSQVLGAHVCNPSYSGSRDQEDQGSRPVQAKNLRRSHLSGKNVCSGAHLLALL